MGTITPIKYGAPWSRALVVLSPLATLACFGVALFARHRLFPFAPLSIISVTLTFVLFLPVVCIFFAITGYEISNGTLWILRPGWKKAIPLDGLQQATYEPNVTKGSIRLCGNGGLFSFTGWFRNKKLGTYRAFATNSTNCVVLRFANRTIVVTPDKPEGFIRSIKGQPLS